MEQLTQHARTLAREHHLVNGTRNNDLLKRLSYNATVLRDFNQSMLITKKPRHVTSAAEWLVDNFYLIEEHIQLVKRHLPKRYSHELPCLSGSAYHGFPRIYAIVLEFISHVDAQMDQESIHSFFKSYQTESILKLGELWAVPIMLRIALIENLQRICQRVRTNQRHRELANSWVEKLQEMARKSPSRLVETVSDMAKSDIPTTSAFVSEFCQRLSSHNPMLHMARSWLEQRLAEEGLSIESLIHTESQNQAANQVSVSHSIGSLRFIGTADWKAFVEDLSFVDQTLRKDPDHVYHLVDFATRDRYRHEVETLARRSALSEVEIANQALHLAEASLASGDSKRQCHIGYYLVDEGHDQLVRSIPVKRSLKGVLKTAMRRIPLTIYVGGIGLLSTLVVMLFIQVMRSQGTSITDWRFLVLIPLFLLCASQFAISVANWIAMLLVKPHLLPRLDFSEGIAPGHRTIVVIPCMLSSQERITSLIETLELHYLANRDDLLHFALLSDFCDAKQPTTSEDDALIEYAREGIEALNRQYSPDKNRLFFLFHRSRQWNPSENQWMGFERKRGKLMALNAFLRGANPVQDFSIICGDTEVLSSIQYVITLDADTQLPRDAARKLVGTMAHPLNHPEFDPIRNKVIKGYAILQPRMSSSLSSSQCSCFSRLFSSEAGIDPYTRAVSDVYQDIFHEGTFVGKGIYQVDAFERGLSGRFPDNWILSHDLLESAYVRSALISDVELYEDFPSNYKTDASRRHRWIRGDWQIARWLLPKVPTSSGTRERNPLSPLAKWKIFDNLRRSLVPPSILAFLIGSGFLFPEYGWAGASLVFAIVVLPVVFSMSACAFFKAKDQGWWLYLRETGEKGKIQLEQILLWFSLLPYDAYISLDAILRTLKRLITKKRLLEWQASDITAQSLNHSLYGFYLSMWFSPLFALVCGILMGIYYISLLPYTLPVLLVWLASPYIAWRISRPYLSHPPAFNKEQTRLLHQIARKTWHFFDTFVTAEENWLPPDNFQERPIPTIASRTSPTNIGLSLLANLAAFDFGYIPVNRLIDRTRQTLDTVNQLKKFRGHLYNWYDTRTLDPLPPHYVSTVDSGNLAGHLLTLGQGLLDLKNSPIYSKQLFSGMLDTMRVMNSQSAKHPIFLQLENILEKTHPPSLHTAYDLLISIQKKITEVRDSLAAENEPLRAWADILKRECQSHQEELAYIAPWVEVIDVSSTHTETLASFRQELIALDQSATLNDIAALEQTLCVSIENAIYPDTEAENSNQVLLQWLPALRKAAQRAAVRIQELEDLARQCNDLAEMDFVFLYNTSKKLFTIGYNVVEQRADAGFYDLLASEARLGSYVAIAQGQIPQEHWFSLSRLLVVSQGDPILLSWSGSMFEYLMPLLVMPNFESTLLDHTCKAAVQEQIEYGKKLGVPWGISESGYNRTDTQLNYQYRAFGIPSIGLKRGLSEDLVIAPYATVMALMVEPKRACANLQRLSAEGQEGIYGYYEAIDYTPSHLRPDESKATIYSFMAHHQGMSLLSLSNLMSGNSMQQRFMRCPMLKSADLLLQERISKNITANRIGDDSQFELEGLHPLQPDHSSVNRVFKGATPSPEVHLLSNGRYHVMISNSGGGYSRWRNLAVTRWREDATRDCWGMFVYLRDKESGDLWSTAHQPTLRNVKKYEAIFTQAYAEFRQHHLGIEVHTCICVSPEDDMELRRVILTNRTRRSRSLEMTSYGEVVLAPQSSDEAHPAFSNLFVQTEFIPSSSAIFCTRRARSTEESPPHLIHMMLLQGEEEGTISCETDRSRFIGRGNTLVNPASIQNSGPLSNTSGAVLDPIIALRRTVIIPPGKSVTLYIAMGMAETREDATILADKYQHIRICERAFELAWTHSQVTLYQLNATDAEAQLYSKLASALVYSTPSLRSTSSILKSNRRGQNGLWSYGISGDVPLVLLRINSLSGIDLVRQMVQAHAYWRIKGLVVELVIVNEDISVYRQPLHDEIINLISSGIEAPLLEKPGGLFVRRIEQIPREDLLLFQSVARIILDDGAGSLAKQLSRAPLVSPPAPALIPTRMVSSNIVTELPQRDLVFNNGLGGFTRDGREYVITLHPGQNTPAPWVNVLANNQFGTVISESGGSYTWMENAHEFRLTPWNNDPVKDFAGEAFYIRDEQTGQFWSPTPLPARGATPYVIRHGFGYTIFEHSENGIQSELCVYVARDLPVKFSVLKLRNLSGRPRRLSVTGYYEWVLADLRHKSLLHIQTETDLKTGALIARNFYNSEFPTKIAFIDVGEPCTVSGDRHEFIGQNGTLAQPAAMKQSRLSGKTGAGLDPCGAMQVVFDLAADEEREVRFRLGTAHSTEELYRSVTSLQRTGTAREKLENVWTYWNRTLGTLNVDTPDASVNMMANGWLLYQTISARILGRTGFYQSGGAYGFRDQLQDVMALVHAEPSIARTQILRAAGRQFPQGDVQHWWHPPQGRGVRTHFSDDYLWLPYVTCHYVTSVGDTGILDENIPFLEGRPLRPDEESYYDLPGLSDESATLYEHCVRSIEYGLQFGEHGLPLIGCGDWNDGMNLIGKEGRGESVWLGFFLYDVLLRFSKIASARNDHDFAERCVNQAHELQSNIERNAWDGQWYRRAYFDNGKPLGSHLNQECQIDSLPQSWAVISRAGNPERAAQAMEQVNQRLVRRNEKLIQLFTPPFDKSDLNPGYIKGYVPGVRENGGQYTHGAIWTAMAFALLGKTERAWELFHLLNPIQHGSTLEQIAIYKVEPYVIAADVYAASPHTGRGGWTWYTGSAAWMYRLLVETLLGIRREGEFLYLTPLLPEDWPSYKVHYRYHQTVYHITISRLTDNTSPGLDLDGQPLPDKNRLFLTDDQKEHFVEMRIEFS